MAVVIGAGVERKLVDEKVNGPPAAPEVVFCTATVAEVAVITALVNTQLICAPAKTFAAGIVSTLPAKAPKVPTLPVTAELASVQLAADALKLAAGVSVTVTAVL